MGPGADPALPSLLPDWTRGHVLTHIARNADSFVRVLDAARRGEVVTQYEGGVAGRNADIEAGAARDWDTLVADVRSSAARLEEVFAAQDRWDLAMTNSPRASRCRTTDLPFRRLREVVVHHADLGDDGYTPADWPEDYVREDLRRMEMLFNARQPMGATGLPDAAGGPRRCSVCAGYSAAATSRASHRPGSSRRDLMSPAASTGEPDDGYRWSAHDLGGAAATDVATIVGEEEGAVPFVVVGVATQAEGVGPQPVDGVVQPGTVDDQLPVELDGHRTLPRRVAGVLMEVEQGSAVETLGELPAGVGAP